MWVAESTVITDVVKTYTVKVNVYGKDTAGVEEVQYTPEECFTFTSSTETITNYSGVTDTCPSDVVIPKAINGVAVKAIGATNPYAKQSLCTKGITNVTIPDSVKMLETSL